MAPLTRNRAGPGFVPGDLTAEYYGQHASAGLLISEATQTSQQGQGYQDTPGIYSRAQIEGWSKVTTGVHAKGGRISCSSGMSAVSATSTFRKTALRRLRLRRSGLKPRRSSTMASYPAIAAANRRDSGSPTGGGFAWKLENRSSEGIHPR